MFVCSTHRITGSHYTYGCSTLSAAYVGYTGLHFTYRYSTVTAAYFCYVYLQNNRITLHLWVRYFKSSLFFNVLATESHVYNHYGCPTLNAA